MSFRTRPPFESTNQRPGVMINRFALSFLCIELDRNEICGVMLLYILLRESRMLYSCEWRLYSELCASIVLIAKYRLDDTAIGEVPASPVFCPGFQKGRVPSEKGTLAR